MESPQANPVTQLLMRLRADDSKAVEQLLPLLYDELRQIARGKLARSPGAAQQTLQPTALVHEAYMRLVEGHSDAYESRRHFFFAAARAMQDILVEQARRRASLKRGGGRARVELDADQTPGAAMLEEPVEDVAALGEALEELEKSQPRKAQLVRLRYFAGLSMQEIASVMEVSEPTVRRELRFTRALLSAQLRGSREVDDADGAEAGSTT